MKQTEFVMLCGELLIDIGIALENEHIQEALRGRASLEELRRILTEEF